MLANEIRAARAQGEKYEPMQLDALVPYRKKKKRRLKELRDILPSLEKEADLLIIGDA